MVTPTIKFFTTSKAENIAYGIHGRGDYLVVPAWWVSHLELDWQTSSYQEFFQALGKYHTIVRYDRPGVGLSDRQRNSFELEDEVRVLTELIDHLEIKSCCLLGISCGGPAAIKYASRFPHRVDKMVLVGSFVDGRDIGNKEIQNALCSLVSASWGLGAKAIIDLFDPEMDTSQRNALGKTHALSSSALMATELLKLTFKMDATDSAKSLIKSVLVLHKSKDKTVRIDAGKRLAIMIPNAEFKTIEGKSHLPWSGSQAEQFISEIVNFTTKQSNQFLMQPNQFRKLGDIWSISYSGESIHLKDALGLQNIAQLIINSGKEIHVRSLAAGENLESYFHSQSIEILDRQALNNYRQRLSEITEQKSIAAKQGDETEYAKLELEQDGILNELNRATGMAGKTRNFNSDDEKARKSVSARIRNSINRIRALHPELAEHLNHSVKTGLYCCYNSEEQTLWLT